MREVRSVGCCRPAARGTFPRPRSEIKLLKVAPFESDTITLPQIAFSFYSQDNVAKGSAISIRHGKDAEGCAV